MNAGQQSFQAPIGSAVVRPSQATQTIRVSAVRIPQQMQAARSDVVLVADGSGSVAGQKLTDEIAAQEAFALVKARLDPDGQIGLIVFANDASKRLELTPARESGTILAAIRSLRADGETNISAGLAAAGVLLSRRCSVNPRFVVLLSDGHHNSGGEDPLIASGSLKHAGVVVYTVGLGTDPSDVDPRLPAIASSPDKYVFLRDKDSLVKHFEFVSRQTSIRSQRP